MSQPWVHLLGRAVIDDDNRTGADVSIPNNGVQTRVVSLTTKMGKRCFLTAVKQAWDASMDTYVTWSLLENGVSHAKFPFSTAQKFPPESDSKLPTRIEVGQGALLEIVAINPSTSSTGNMTGVIEVEYEDF